MPTALSLLIEETGLDGSVTEKLSEIASGRWNRQSQPRAGKKEKRKCLKVPVAKTSCGRNHFILWQIVIGADAETDLSQQEIKGGLPNLREQQITDLSQFGKYASIPRYVYPSEGVAT